VLLKTLQMYSLNPKFIYCFTTDNGANMLKTVSLIREMNRDYDYNENISKNEHNFESDQVHINEENSKNVSKCSDEIDNVINEQENENNHETLP
jgi:3'-phosphoadenosine 5'-phosphosulfate sulfotransferase (PAPS reductase)/FAD synthetase